jgi:hypothetical protein
MKQIQDKFTSLPVCRQRKYQLRMREQGRCQDCGAKATQGGYCEKHQRKQDKQTVKITYLGRWLQTQKELHQLGLLPPEMVAQLESLGVDLKN